MKIQSQEIYMLLKVINIYVCNVDNIIVLKIGHFQNLNWLATFPCCTELANKHDL